MDNQFTEELTSHNTKKNFNIYLLIITILILIISISVIIVLVIKLNNKTKNYDEIKEELQTIKNDYSKQNDTLNDIFKVFQNLISITNITNNQIQKENYINVKKVVESTKGFKDGTYDFVTKQPLSFAEGYQVAFETFSRNSENFYSDEEYDNIVYKLSCLIGSNANIGIYGDNPHISFYVKDKNISLSLSALFNQKSIWDWSTNNEILNTFHQPKYY